MKFLCLAICFLSIMSFSACKRTDTPAQTEGKRDSGFVPSSKDKVVIEPGKRGPITRYNYSQHELDSIATLPPVNRPADPKTAIGYWMSTPPRLSIGPYLLPLEHVEQISVNDTVAVFGGTAPQAPMSAVVTLEKKHSGSETFWLVTKIEESGIERR